MGRRKKIHDKCRQIAAVRFSGDNFICAGENRDPVFACDTVRLCVKGAVSHRTQEMTVQEAETIRDCLSEAIKAVAARIRT